MFTVRIRGCSHFVKLKCIRKKLGPGKIVHYRGCSHFRGVHIPRFHCNNNDNNNDNTLIFEYNNYNNNNNNNNNDNNTLIFDIASFLPLMFQSAK